MEHQASTFVCVVAAALLLTACEDSGGVPGPGPDAGVTSSEPDTGTDTEANPGDTSTEPDTDTPQGLYDDLILETFPGSGEEMEVIDVTVEPGDESVHMTFIGADRLGDVGVLQVRDPRGQLVYDFQITGADFTLESEQWLYPAVGLGAAALLIPPTSAFDDIEGTWQVSVIAPGHSLTAIQTLRKRDVGASEHALDLDIWFAVDRAPLGTQEEQTAFIDAVVAEMDPILAPHQMSIGDVSLRDRNAQLGSQYARLDVENLEALCEETAAEEAPRRALRLVVVDVINDGGFPCCGGVAPAAPGPVLREDAPPSCVVVSYDAYGASYAEHAGNFLHEGAHFLGLPHTTEFDGSTFDRFTDTPACDAETFDQNGDGQVDDFECGAEGGASNFLFAGGVPEFLPYHASEQQAAAMRVHPLFRPLN